MNIRQLCFLIQKILLQLSYCSFIEFIRIVAREITCPPLCDLGKLDVALDEEKQDDELDEFDLVPVPSNLHFDGIQLFLFDCSFLIHLV